MTRETIRVLGKQITEMKRYYLKLGGPKILLGKDDP